MDTLNLEIIIGLGVAGGWLELKPTKRAIFLKETEELNDLR